MARNIVALVPAHNEEESIGATIEALLAQTRPLDKIVIIPNGCTDGTAEIAYAYAYAQGNPSVVVLELPKLKHRKAQALNIGWQNYARDADIVISIDADTLFDPNAIRDWELDFVDNAMARAKAAENGKFISPLGGTAAKATMPKSDFLSRLQKAEFAKSVDICLMRGRASVLPGAGAAFDNAALHQITLDSGQEGPWSYESAVEDYRLTLDLRARGYLTITSPWVRMYTDSMHSIRALWTQRLKWSGGTIEELLSIGVTRLTLRDWVDQAMGMLMVLVRLLWIAMIALQIFFGVFAFHWFWWLVYPAIFAAAEFHLSRRMPGLDWKDRLIAIAIVPYELFGWFRNAWFTYAWITALTSKLTGRQKDRWELQYRAEGVTSEL